MLKKITMIMLLGFSGVVHSDREQEPSNQHFWLGIVALTGVAAVTGGYLAFRESNEIKIDRVQKLYDFYSGNLYPEIAHIATVHDVAQFATKSAKFKKEMQVFTDLVNNSYYEMNARYGSWIKPWNWSLEMKLAYQRIKELRQTMQLIAIMFRYQPLIVDLFDCLNEAVLAQDAQIICQGASMYPLLSCVEMMQRDLKFLKVTHFKVACDVVVIEILEYLIKASLSTRCYVEEKQLQTDMKLKERQVCAIEQQAFAQQQQAQAQLQQAEAQKERNRIEREKLNK